MATEYTLYVRHEVYLRLREVRGQQRNQLLKFFGALERDPYQAGDYEVTSPEGRPIQVKIVGSLAVLFWPDHAVCEIKVIDLAHADA